MNKVLLTILLGDGCLVVKKSNKQISSENKRAYNSHGFYSKQTRIFLVTYKCASLKTYQNSIRVSKKTLVWFFDFFLNCTNYLCILLLKMDKTCPNLAEMNKICTSEKCILKNPSELLINTQNNLRCIYKYFNINCTYNSIHF